MSIIAARTYDRLKRNTDGLNLREELPFLLFSVAAASIIILAGDIVGHTQGFDGLRWKQMALLCFSIAMTGSAIALDLSIGDRRVVSWFRTATSDLQNVGKFFAVTLELGILVAVIREFRIGNTAFSHVIAPLTFVGFCIHQFLPIRYRQQFFLLLSVVGIWAVLGTASTAWLVGICLVMISICHLPVPFFARVAVLLATAGLLALCRAGRIRGPWPAVIWPILGSILMFRLIVYLYDIQHSKEKISIPTTLSYFFLLPNVVFPLFPVVDYKTFRRSWYDANQYEIYQRGVQWIFRGVTHLIAYRIVYNYLIISPTEVASVGQLVRFLFTNFALYLDVSGTFHIIVGILHLFGFHLPETNHRYFLSSSFNDIWRRTNIYWKDFMMKVFYYPAYFRLRKLGNTPALILSTLFIFVVTWFLHAYQWFWLRGSFVTSQQDLLFWTLLGMLVLGNSLYEMKFGRKRSLGTPEWNLSTFAPVALRIAGTMTSLCILWSLWTSSSISEWISLWYLPGKKLSGSLGSLTTMLMVGVVVGGVTHFSADNPKKVAEKPERFSRSAMVASFLFLVVYLAGNPAVYSRFGSRAARLMGTLRSEHVNQQDAALLQRSYYEDLKVERFDSNLWDIYQKVPADWKPIGETEAGHLTNDFEWLDLRPNSAIVLKGAPFHTNRWGMRDQDYNKEKSHGTYRYAMVGASVSMGSGVNDDETFESILERRLNSEKDPRSPYSKYEILNFSVGGYSPLQYLWVVEHRIGEFQPDAILYIAHGDHDEERTVYFLAKFIRTGVDIPYEYLKEVAQRAGVDRNTPEAVAEKRLQPYGKQMLSWIYSRIVEDCRKRGILPISVYLQVLDEQQMPPANAPAHIKLAQDAGFITVNVSNWFSDQDIPQLKIAEWDSHPNAKGHQMIADRLYEELEKKSKTAPIGFPGGMIDDDPKQTSVPAEPRDGAAAPHS